MKHIFIRFLIFASAGFLRIIPLMAQDEQINWFAFTGGGGMLNSSENSVVSSVGQNFAGLSTAEDNRVTSGFWNSQVSLSTAVKDLNGSQPGFILNQNYPNPFTTVTTISWQIPVSSKVTLEIYDILGNKIKSLVNEYQSPGNYQADFYNETLPSGLYVIRLKAGNFTDSKRMNLIR